MYHSDEFNAQTGPQWGMKFFYLTSLFGQHRNSVNWSLTHLDQMMLNAYWYRDGKLQDWPVCEIKPNQEYLLRIDTTGGMVRWLIDGHEVYRIKDWNPKINWIFSPFYGKSGKATAPHEMRMKINFFNKSALCRERQSYERS